MDRRLVITVQIPEGSSDNEIVRKVTEAIWPTGLYVVGLEIEAVVDEAVPAEIKIVPVDPPPSR